MQQDSLYKIKKIYEERTWQHLTIIHLYSTSEHRDKLGMFIKALSAAESDSTARMNNLYF